MKFRILNTAGTISLLLVLVSFAHANLITNGDFEAGNIGFSSGYPFVASTTMLPIGYILTDNPSPHHPLSQSFGDHTTGSGLMMMVNGSIQGTVVWSQTTTITPNSSFDFSIFIRAW